LLLYHICHVTVFTEVEVEAVVALPAHADDRHFLTAAALYEFTDILARFHDHLDGMAYRVVAPHFHSLKVTCVKAVLAHAKVLAISANKKCANDGAHETVDTFAIAVSGQSIAELWNFEALELVILAQ
jgi:hypothetical protein